MDKQSTDTIQEGLTPPSNPTATVQPSSDVNALASSPNILSHFADMLEHCGVVGEKNIGMLIYLALTSRVLHRPVSLAVKGPSSGGKSFITQQVLRFFPESAYYALTAMSDKSLVYSEEDLRNRFLVLFEAESLKSDMASYLIRSLLSEGRIRYETVVSSSSGLSSQFIEKEGPTGLLITTTATSLHAENETRFLSLTVQDTPEQTRAILRSMARSKPAEIDLSIWVDLQSWIDTANHNVTIPFAEELANLSIPASVRFRRDFRLILNLIKTHAILHQENRESNDEGYIMAQLEDYTEIYNLVAEIISEGLGVMVPDTVRQTVDAVRLINEGKCSLTDETYGLTDCSPSKLIEVAQQLGIDKSSASRRVNQAIKLGYLVNSETIKGKPMSLVIGDPLPEEQRVIPSPNDLKRKLMQAEN